MRRLLGLLLFVLILAVCTACNPAEKEEPSGGDENLQGRKPDFSQDQPVKLGFNLEMTGDAATFGLSAKEGAEIAIDEINTSGGLLGQPVVVVYDDNATKSEQAASVASKLINEDKVDVLIGCVASSMSIAMARVAEAAKVPMVTPASTKPSVTVDENGKVHHYVFRTCFTDDFQAERMARYAVDGLKAKRAVIFYDAEQDYSVGIYDMIKKVAPDLGLEIVAEDSFLSSTETDFRSKLNKFKTQPFDVLIVPGYYNKVALIANQAREVGLTQPLLGGDGFDSVDLWKNAGVNIEGSYFTNHYAADDQDPAVQNFVTKYKQRYAKLPDAMAILGYDATIVVADAIKRAGSRDKEAITDALAATKNFQAATGMITLNEQHNAVKKLVVIKVGVGGKFEWVYTYQPEDETGAVPTGETTTEPVAVGDTPSEMGELPPAEGEAPPAVGDDSGATGE